jgi:hypothetical protein
MLFEHVTPSLDDIQQSLFERFGIDTKPRVKHWSAFKTVHFDKQFLVRVDLETKENDEILND